MYKSWSDTMKKLLFLLTILLILLTGCGEEKTAQIVATTLPVYEFTNALCEGTGLTVSQLVTEEVSCLHDYTVQVSQMRAVESAQVVVCNGAGLEEFLEDVLASANHVVDASVGIETECHETHSEEHHHEQDPHIWLSPVNAKVMCENICNYSVDILEECIGEVDEEMMREIEKAVQIQIGIIG